MDEPFDLARYRLERSGPARGLPVWIDAALVLTAVLALLVPALVVLYGPRVVGRGAQDWLLVPPPTRIVPQGVLPPVEPVRFADLTPDEARAYNAAQPFSTEPSPAARPFRVRMAPDDLARATDCLAAAVVYEAGDDSEGERAVAQVVLNRLRHPAFPKTVCGVVFQGAERTTGCQFTFTCDGALTRWKPSDVAWTRARQVATLALSGGVYRPVGYATHYHTDWVVPYWQSSLDKIAAVHTHLFFRWSGWWGTPPAFNRQVQPGEPVIAALAPLSLAHLDPSALAAADPATDDVASAAAAPVEAEPGSFLVTLPKALAPDLYPALATKACGDRGYCKFLAWADPATTPKALPLSPAQIAVMTFSYLRDRGSGYEKALWNCGQVKRPDPTQCMKQQTSLPSFQPPVDLSEPPASPIARGAAELTGVRRRSDGLPTPPPPAAAATSAPKPTAPAQPPQSARP